MGSVVTDASLLLAAFDPQDVHHAAARRAIDQHRASSGLFILSAIAFAEVLVGAAREGFLERRRKQILDAYGQVRPIDAEVAETAAALRSSHRALRLPDALVVATAVVDGAQMWTFDRKLARVDDRVEVIS